MNLIDFLLKYGLVLTILRVLLAHIFLDRFELANVIHH